MPARAPGGGFYEVWLLDRSAKRLVALGLLGPSESGSFRLPPDLDLGRYPLVDVSVEPDDGNPAHSGVSAVRGDLRA
jgi:anti-sigma-K factor RskA